MACMHTGMKGSHTVGESWGCMFDVTESGIISHSLQTHCFITLSSSGQRKGLGNRTDEVVYSCISKWLTGGLSVKHCQATDLRSALGIMSIKQIWCEPSDICFMHCRFMVHEFKKKKKKKTGLLATFTSQLLSFFSSSLPVINYKVADTPKAWIN